MVSNYTDRYGAGSAERTLDWVQCYIIFCGEKSRQICPVTVPALFNHAHIGILFAASIQ